ncbi:GrpB family protein [Brevibacillus fluminis]|uniref:GrpB family protein n=1 Tax=Brevibacillus fluminis TaxID=511487 RepID=A0A3M8DQQ0_9BACL|nr:GrpB family protein [Brevibacillus fluminis]RNB89859.1 GrpB family protein [Brevibacillus fluminis]
MSEKIIIVPYDESWPELFQEVGQRLRQALQEKALRIDHIGSTSIPGLAAKPIIDIQISVTDLEEVESYKGPLVQAGFVHRSDNPELTKRYFRETPGARRTHIHMRRAGSWPEQFALLFRDYLRLHPEDCLAYAELKYQLAAMYMKPHERSLYVEAKEPFIWGVMKKADKWSQEVGWQQGKSDA